MKFYFGLPFKVEHSINYHGKYEEDDFAIRRSGYLFCNFTYLRLNKIVNGFRSVSLGGRLWKYRSDGSCYYRELFVKITW